VWYAGILSQTSKMKRKIEMVAVERIRIRGTRGQIFCPVCQKFADFLTTAQAAEVAGVRAQSVRRWLVNGKAHGIKTVGGRHRVCRCSLFSQDAFFYVQKQ
jgi:hypothetical protein